MSLRRTDIRVTTHALTTAGHSKEHFFLYKNKLYTSLQTIKSSPKVSLMKKLHKKLLLIWENISNFKNVSQYLAWDFYNQQVNNLMIISYFQSHGICG